MRVPVKLLGFGIWLLSLHCARCEECLREDIKYENTEPIEKASYPDGETVKVNCMTGYAGLYKLKCEKGKWKNIIERQCAKKKCSHPGDTPNGDFKLTEGTEFVFGATVVYTCKTGYEMVSRISQRTCRAQGWDNTVPLCEVVKCPAVRTDGDVTASGNTEEGSYGEVIHFECVSSEKMIAGSSEIHCKETGKWSDSVPKCIDIKCTAPDIPNGQVEEKMSEFRKGAVLQYKCNPGFKKREGTPKCAKFGWTVKPECDEVTCDLKSTTFGVKKINPEGKTIFRAGERVEITCSEKYWIFGTKETRKSFTCQYDGRWDSEPVCQEITCEVPRDQHVSYPEYYFRGDMKLETIIYYNCEVGYEKMAAEATCTEDGWTPKPLCEKMCAAPYIPNAEIVKGKTKTSKYQIYSKIKYQCLPGFEPEQPIEITCDSRLRWNGIKQCTEKMCATPDIPNAEIVGVWTQNYRINSRIEYKCSPGFEPEEPIEITCDSRLRWNGIKQCTEKMCATPDIPNAEIVGVRKQNYRINSRIEYKCSPGFEPEETIEITCDSRHRWNGIKQCTEKMCATPVIPNAEIVGVQKQNYRINSRIEYKCSPGFEPEQRIQITCDSQVQWTGIHQCTEKQKLCLDPSLENGFIYKQPSNKENIFYSCNTGYKPFSGKWWDSVTCIKGSWSDEPRCIPKEKCGALPSVHHGKPQQTKHDGQETAFECDPGFIPTQKLIKCIDGTWEKPVCKDVRCGIPPKVENAVITSKPEDFYLNGSSVTYVCQNSFLISGESMVFCHNGAWGETPTCQEITCEYPQDQHVSKSSLWGKIKLGEKQSYSCEEGYRETAEKATCTRDGWTPNPLCTGQDSRTCGRPLHIINSEIKDMVKKEYNTGEKVEYKCADKYILDMRHPFSNYLTCEQGKWSGNIKCLKPCTVTKEIMDGRGIEFAYAVDKKIIAPHDDHIEFRCQGHKDLKRNELRQRCNDGEMTLPECE